jgi:hypothetical protein
MQQALSDSETKLDKLFGKGAPYQMSDKSKRALAGATWAIALIIGILQALSALALWHIGHAADAAITYSNYVAATYGSNALVPQLGLFFYISIIAVVADAVLLLMAVPALKEFRRHGWDLLFYSLLLNVIYGFLRSFSNVGGGLGQFILQLFFSAVVGYFLFQIRGTFIVGEPKKAASSHAHSDAAPAGDHADHHHETDK